MVYIDANRTFTSAGEKIRLLATDFLLCATVGYLTRLKNLGDSESQKDVLLLSFLTEAFILDAETSVEELIIIFAANILERILETAAETSEREIED